MVSHTTKIFPKEESRPEAAAGFRELHVGAVLWNRYEVTAVLGASVLGQVWCCLDRETGKSVSLRWLPPDMRRSRQVMALLHAVIRRISDKDHPNLAPVRQLIYVGEQIYVIGDYAPGQNVGTWTQAGAGGKRSLDEVLPVLKQAAAGLDFAHAQRIVHRNLKPSNVYLDQNGSVRVTDFGLSPRHHLTIIRGEAVRAGAPSAYLAPELHAGEEEDAASDQYALGALAWEMLVGRSPAPGEEPPADLPDEARSALRRALAEKPRNRFVDCSDFARALAGERVSSRRGRSAAEWRRIRVRLGLAAGAIAAGAALVLGGPPLIAWLATPRAPPEKPKPTPTQAAKEKPKDSVPEPVKQLVATTPIPVQGQPWVTQTGGMQFVWVPAMQMWIGRFEVANAEFALKDPEHDSGDFRGLCLKGDRQPVVRVNFDDANAYAAWLTEQERVAGKLLEGWRYRLPSRTEAIAYTQAGIAHQYPWGDRWPPIRGNYADDALGAAFSDLPSIPGYQDGFAATAPVEYSGENVWGLFGAGGNVWETTAKAAGYDQFGGWQGGGWDDHLPGRLGCEVTYGYIGNARGAVNGFRLVLAPISGEAPPPPAAQAAPASAAPPPG